MLDSLRAAPDSLVGWRAVFAFTVTLAMGVGGLIQFSVGALAPFLIEDLALTRTQFGSLTTALYLVAGLASPPAGSLVDVLGGRRLLLWLFALGALALVMAATAWSYVAILAATSVAGLSLAMANPVTNQLVGLHIPAGERGTIMGIKQSGAQLAALLAGGVLPTGAVVLGWRAVLLGALVLPLIGVMATVGVIPRRGPRGRGLAQSRTPHNAAVWWLSAYSFFMGVGVAAVIAYLPLYGYERLGLTVTAAGWAVALPGLVGIVARIVLARSVERMRSVTLPMVALGLCAVLSLLMIWAALAVGAWLLWAGAVGVGVSALAWPVVGMLSLLRHTDITAAGRASGVMLLSTFAGFVSSPVAFGYAVDITGSYAVGWAGVALALTGAVVTAIWWRVRERSAGPHGTTPAEGEGE